MARITTFQTSLILICAVQSLSLLFLYLNYANYTAVSKKQIDKVHVLILSSWRSGSSLAGQIFSQHPSVFYLMEPAWHVWKMMAKDDVNILHTSVRDLLRSVFHCDMSVFDFYLPKNKTKSNLFMWENSRALCTPPACDVFRRTTVINSTVCKRLCSKSTFDTVEKSCKTYSHVVLKEVRLFNLESLYPLITDPSLNLRIIHFIRDPRAVFNSRQSIVKSLRNDNKIILNSYPNSALSDANYKVMEEICKSHVQIYSAAAKHGSTFLKSRYLMVRFEDLVKNPLAKVKEMYSFVDLAMNRKLENWIQKVTHGKGKNHSPFQITSLNALSLSEAWRNALSFKDVSKIQSFCREAMDILEYHLIKSEKDLRVLSGNLFPKNSSSNNKKQFWN
ncbi:carbohydrate sulfotransferase 6-like [Protopterus annectens]|uniref:carbohydrate sulfotransferase 6-like n=1 Tax=Protopterus annectens TaxID=7888 RepID=UPI001CFBC721|nr:carbohydrate sulfotransferase 6-like [Protopterus annectens]